MKAFQIQNGFGLENLKPADLPDPSPGPGQVLVRVRAASLNYRDLMMARGHYNPDQPLPLTPLSDGAGEVAAVGPGVTRAKVGDRVAGIFTQGWVGGDLHGWMWAQTTLGGPLPGMLAEYAVLGEQGVVMVPPHLSFEEAATLPCAAVTAWNALVEVGRVRAGQTVLVQGTGGVSIFALQFAKMHGARVIATSSSDAKLQVAKNLGCDESINYRSTPDWERAALDLTGGAGVDHVVEVGGAGTLPRSMAATRVDGHVHVIGLLSVAQGGAAPVDPLPILRRALRVRGVLVGSREMFEHMNAAISQSKLKPVIDRAFDFADASAAFRHLESASHVGKVVIRID